MTRGLSLKEYLALIALSALNLWGEPTVTHMIVSGFLFAVIPIYVEAHYQRK